MFNFQIKTYREGLTPSKPHFFILSRGLNTGKPLDELCPNCFLVETDSEESRNFHYWLCYALWQTDHFKPHLIGSVIPFIHISTLRNCLEVAKSKALKDRAAYIKSLALLQDFEKKAKILKQQVELFSQVKKAIFFKILYAE